jgi:hypothetical protein
MKTSVLLLGCLLATASLAQSTATRREVWEWKDADGVTHYSDYPSPGARKIVLVGSTPTAVAPSTPEPAARNAPKPRAPADVQYDRLEIWLPANDATYFGADAVVEVRLRSEPALAPGDRVLTYLDGKLLPGENQYEHSLSGVVRGAHALTSVILDAKGNEKIRSAQVVFHVRQPGVANPRSQGPALRPPQPKTTGG